MKFITLIFTTICFLAFAEVQAVMGNEPAFPSWVESGDDPPDCTSTAIATEQHNYKYLHSQEDSGPLITPSTSNKEHNVFGYRATVAAGGVGRTQRCFAKLYRDTIARGPNESI